MKKEIVRDKYYVYKWFIVETGEVFYIGKGINERCFSLKKRNDYFKNIKNKYNCDVDIIEYCNSENEAFEKEKEYIAYYKSIGMARANFHVGGLGGDTLKYNQAKKAKFVKKMTEINRERCASDEFKRQAREHMILRYSDPKEREKQSLRQQSVWTEEKRKQQSDLIKTINANTDVVKLRTQKLKRKCCFEFNDTKIIFDSRKEALDYIRETFNLTLSRKVEQKMLHNKIPYNSLFERYKFLNGMLLYYI